MFRKQHLEVFRCLLWSENRTAVQDCFCQPEDAHESSDLSMEISTVLEEGLPRVGKLNFL